MAISKKLQGRIRTLKESYDILKKGKESLLTLLDEAELPEAVYNSNAIENSTLTLGETEKILLEMEVSRAVSVREVFEAKNLARVSEYLRKHASMQELEKDTVLFLHQMLLNGIDDAISGRFRTMGEYVRVGTHIAPPPEQVERRMGEMLAWYATDVHMVYLEKIARFHLEFETLHPFCDGNGRIGRVLINWQLTRFGFPSIIIRDKEKAFYYKAFDMYRAKHDAVPMERVLTLALMESLHKRIAYLAGATIVRVVDVARASGTPAPILLNAARRQTIPAFREKGVWKIVKDYKQ